MSSGRQETVSVETSGGELHSLGEENRVELTTVTLFEGVETLDLETVYVDGSEYGAKGRNIGRSRKVLLVE